MLQPTASTGADRPAPQPPAPRRGRLASLLRIAAVPAVIGAIIGITGALSDRAPSDPYEAAAERAGADLLAMPGFEERFGDLDEEAAYRAGMELGMAAIPHLPDPELDEWLTITNELMDGLEGARCAALVRADAETSAKALLDVVRILDVETFERYLGIVVSGIRLELSGELDPDPPSAAQLDAAYSALLAEIGTERLLEIEQMFVSPQTASDDEMCTAMKEMYRAIAALDPAARHVLIRMVTEPVLAT